MNQHVKCVSQKSKVQTSKVIVHTHSDRETDTYPTDGATWTTEVVNN